MPFLLVGVLFIFVVPSLLKKKTPGPKAKTLAAETIDARNVIDRAEQSYKQAHGRFAAHLADLLPGHPGLAADLSGGAAITLDVATDGQTYIAQVENANISVLRSRSGGKLIADSCVVVKSASGVSCPKS
jgi:hypothetical protein